MTAPTVIVIPVNCPNCSKHTYVNVYLDTKADFKRVRCGPCSKLFWAKAKIEVNTRKLGPADD